MGQLHALPRRVDIVRLDECCHSLHTQPAGLDTLSQYEQLKQHKRKILIWDVCKPGLTNSASLKGGWGLMEASGRESKDI